MEGNKTPEQNFQQKGDGMEFTDQLTALSTRALKQKDIIRTEEATKNALVMPFIQNLWIVDTNQTALGQADVGTTMIYTHCVPHLNRGRSDNSLCFLLLAW